MKAICLVLCLAVTVSAVPLPRGVNPEGAIGDLKNDSIACKIRYNNVEHVQICAEGNVCEGPGVPDPKYKELFGVTLMDFCKPKPCLDQSECVGPGLADTQCIGTEDVMPAVTTLLDTLVNCLPDILRTMADRILDHTNVETKLRIELDKYFRGGKRCMQFNALQTQVNEELLAAMAQHACSVNHDPEVSPLSPGHTEPCMCSLTCSNVMGYNFGFCMPNFFEMLFQK